LPGSVFPSCNKSTQWQQQQQQELQLHTCIPAVAAAACDHLGNSIAAAAVVTVVYCLQIN